jgi:hypothetical protein
MSATSPPASARVAALRVHPVKSCRGIALARARLAATGLERDRHWMWVRPDGRFLTQREEPRLAVVETALAADHLELRAPGLPPLRVPFGAAGSAVEVAIWRDRCRGLDQGEEAARWGSRHLAQPVRLVAFDPSRPRASDPAWTGGAPARTEFSDGFALLVLSEASLAGLNARLAAPLPMDRFRPNLVLAGVGAHDEDRIDELASASGVRLRLVKPCTRCRITTTDQATGEVRGDEPLRTLAGYRLDRELRGVAFGQNAIVVAGAGRELRVGEELRITWRP